jgi:hypothetical protein
MPQKLTTEKFIEKARKIHGNKYDYSKIIYKNAMSKIEIICPVHGSFFQRPINHIQSKGCYKCRKYKSNTIEFIENARKIHGNKYDYSKVNYIKNNINVEIVCPIHGSFFQHPSSHLKGADCKKCSIDITRNKQILTKEKFLKQTRIIHGYKYDYTNTNYITCAKFIEIKCYKHGIFRQRANDHLRGSGCPLCNESKGERKIRLFMENHNIKYEYQKKFSDCINPKTGWKLKFDFYIPSQNTLIEYDGEQHLRKAIMNGKYKMTNKDLKCIRYRDRLKNEYSKNKKIPLIRINYKKINNIENILRGKLCHIV